MNLNIWAYVAIAAIITTTFVACSSWLIDIGYDRCIAEQQDAQKEQLEKDAKTIDELRKKEKIRETIVAKFKAANRDRKHNDCRTVPYVDGDANKLRDAYNAIARPPPN